MAFFLALCRNFCYTKPKAALFHKAKGEISDGIGLRSHWCKGEKFSQRAKPDTRKIGGTDRCFGAIYEQYRNGKEKVEHEGFGEFIVRIKRYAG